MAVIPSLDLIVSWSSRNMATIATRNEAFKQLVRAVTDTRVSIVNNRWHINGVVTYPGAKADGLLMNVRMVNCKGTVVILGCYYQRQDQILKDEDAVRTGVINAARTLTARQQLIQ